MGFHRDSMLLGPAFLSTALALRLGQVLAAPALFRPHQLVVLVLTLAFLPPVASLLSVCLPHGFFLRALNRCYQSPERDSHAPPLDHNNGVCGLDNDPERAQSLGEGVVEVTRPKELLGATLSISTYPRSAAQCSATTAHVWPSEKVPAVVVYLTVPSACLNEQMSLHNYLPVSPIMFVFVPAAI
ncbi:hypothetical protein GALMADRAFT_133686 [Galerina marginata CBS 339.88]|uniref:Uncharacterized protein n=1 Tax=Galerina marginata (strain CBS 339.88) TaxID=685588 RepID=A0A067TMH8_GALM3|nr:hypothetical protein GALMADRAFT_133686 [Galerina marginata CBS 339.88]